MQPRRGSPSSSSRPARRRYAAVTKQQLYELHDNTLTSSVTSKADVQLPDRNCPGFHLQGVENLFDRQDRMASYGPMFCDITWGAGGTTAELTLDIAAKMQNMVSCLVCCFIPPYSTIDTSLFPQLIVRRCMCMEMHAHAFPCHAACAARLHACLHTCYLALWHAAIILSCCS